MYKIGILGSWSKTQSGTVLSEFPSLKYIYIILQIKKNKRNNGKKYYKGRKFLSIFLGLNLIYLIEVSSDKLGNRAILKIPSKIKWSDG